MARHALLIGVRHFDDRAIRPLNAPDQDVRSLDAVLRDPAIGAFDNVELCLNEPYESVRRKIVGLCRNRERDDLILLYYSGHGVLDFSGGLHLLTRNSELEQLEAASFGAEEIKGFLNGSRSRRQILILDCCHAGAFVEEGFKDAGLRPAVTEATFDPRGYGRVVMMASSTVQPVPDGPAGLASISPFTRFLAEGLREGLAAPDEAEISAQALALYTETRMRREVPGVTPRIHEDKQAGPIILARNPRPGVERIPAALRAALVDADPLRRGGAIARLAAMLEGEDAALARAARRLLEARLPEENDADARDALRAALRAPAEPRESRVGEAPRRAQAVESEPKPVRREREAVRKRVEAKTSRPPPEPEPSSGANWLGAAGTAAALLFLLWACTGFS